MFKDFLDNFMHRLGYVNESELILRALPKDKQERARKLVRQLNDLRKISDVGQAFTLSTQLSSVFKEALPEVTTKNTRVKDAVRLIGGDVYGYRPAMARLYGLFQNNPFGIYSFVARHHWAVRTAMQVIRDELVNDGFQLIGQTGTSKKRLKDVYRQLKKLKLFELRIDIACHIKLFGNAWILPHKNLLGGPGAFELLAPPRLMPIIDPVTDQIVGWEYSVGRMTVTYPKEKLFQLYQYTVDNYKEIGDPPLTPAILAVEADLAGDSYTNQQFQRGGYMGLIMDMEAPTDDPIGRDPEDVVDDLQDKIDSQFSGVKAAQTVLVTTGLKQAIQLKPPTENVFDLLHQQTAKTVAQCLGVPPEKLAISRSATLQYIPSLVEDSVNAQFDKSINALMALVDEFLNDYILRDMLGITDVRIVASGRYGAMTATAADAIKTLADAGPIITVNQALERILGWEPLPPDNPRGNFVLDNSLNRDPENSPVMVEPQQDDPNFGKSGPRAKLKLTGMGEKRWCVYGDDFLKWAEQIKRGNFERTEKTYAPDSEACTILSFKLGELKFYA